MAGGTAQRKSHQLAVDDHWEARPVQIIADYQGLAIRLTEERLKHILEHPEMRTFEEAIIETLKIPVMVIQSASDAAAHLYYRFYTETIMGDKFICVVVKMKLGDPFVLTAYLTDKPKKGKTLWSASN
jgi:hypothetical protein